MPQFELVSADQPPVFIRARSPETAVLSHLGDAVDGASLTLGTPEAGTGWQAISVGGEPWGQIRPRDRMRFRRD